MTDRRAGHASIWEYAVRPDRVLDFEAAYGPDGDWARLFRRSAGYHRTQLHRDERDPYRYLTIDFWDSVEAWTTFRKEHGADYEALDARCDAYTIREQEIGRFDPVSPIPRDPSA